MSCLPAVGHAGKRRGKRRLLDTRLRLHCFQYLLENSIELGPLAVTVSRNFQLHGQHAVRIEADVGAQQDSKLLTSRPAPTSNATETATSATTRVPRRRLP